jgi:hypothetical protein
LMQPTAILLLLGLAFLPVQGSDAVKGQGAEAPAYTIRLDSADQHDVQFAMRTSSEDLVLETPPAAIGQLRASPACGETPLVSLAPHRWRKPAGCTLVAWSASVSPFEDKSFDATRPVSTWSERLQLWLLTGDLPWLRYRDQPGALVQILADFGGRVVARHSMLAGGIDVPIYIVVGEPVRSYVRGPVRVAWFGDVPPAAKYDRLQRRLVATLARWQSDILPDRSHKPGHFSYVWIRALEGTAPGFFASTGSDAILMQFIPDRQSPDPNAKLEAGILLTGAHEGFHALSGPVSAGKPTWVNESWASYFSYAAARQTLKGRALAVARELFETPENVAVLRAQEMLDAGDGSEYRVFYTRAARFWAAIDAALIIRPNGSGKLAALIKQTQGMQGVNWRDHRSISHFLDQYTKGRASDIVQCHLVEDLCADPSTARAPPQSVGTR